MPEHTSVTNGLDLSVPLFVAAVFIPTLRCKGISLNAAKNCPGTS